MNKCELIAEIGWNHMGDMALAEKMIFEASKSGAEYCKFQTWKVKNLKDGPWNTDGRLEIYNKAVAGDFGTIGDYTPPENITGSDAMTQLRKERDALLLDSDWMVLPDRTSTSEQLAYRTALRDLPANYPNCYLTWDADNGKYIWASVTWPTI